MWLWDASQKRALIKACSKREPTAPIEPSTVQILDSYLYACPLCGAGTPNVKLHHKVAWKRQNVPRSGLWGRHSAESTLLCRKSHWRLFTLEKKRDTRIHPAPLSLSLSLSLSLERYCAFSLSLETVNKNVPRTGTRQVLADARPRRSPERRRVFFSLSSSSL